MAHPSPPDRRAFCQRILIWATLGFAALLHAQTGAPVGNSSETPDGASKGAQDNSRGATTPQTPSYRLTTGTRLVLTDVTVTDDKGQPISGLPVSDFFITDNDKPQRIASFAEHKPELAPPISDRSASNPASYSNALLRQPPPVLNVLLVDITNLDLPDQLYLNYQLTRLIDTLPAGEPVALYWCRESNAVLLQNFTADHAELRTALHKALPVIPPTGREYLSSVNTLHQLAVSLAQLPGRKNVLWFSGGSAFLASPVAGLVSVSPDEDAALHIVYDELESNRIAIYPFDARGLSIYSDNTLVAQQQLMREVAENTGGHAFINTNGLQLEATHLIGTDGAYYSLAYSPEGFKPDGKWHNVRVTLAESHRSFHLSYRHGYYADDPAHPNTSRPNPFQSRRERSAEKASSGSSVAPDRQSPPIIFEVQPISPQAPGSLTPARINLPLAAKDQKRGTLLYTLRYRLPLNAFTVQSTTTTATASMGVAVVAFNTYGSIATHRSERVNLSLNMAKLPFTPTDTLTVDQQIAVPKGNTTLYCAVWDIASRRLGTIQIPLVIPSHPN